DDPWGTPQPASKSSPITREDTAAPPPPPREKTIAATGVELKGEVARAQIAQAVARVPVDTRFLFTVNVGDLRRNDQYAAVLDKLANHAQVKELLATAPCLRPILAGSEWVVFATQSLQDSDRGTVVVGGRWKRADVESCLADDMVKLDMPDKTTMLQLRRVGWVDFLDDHTVYISV